jgi:hypothetical protein
VCRKQRHSSAGWLQRYFSGSQSDARWARTRAISYENWRPTLALHWCDRQSSPLQSPDKTG